jgi:glycosyltransferase involved in cell wall biosynthesis
MNSESDERNPAVSVIIPTYNSERTLEKCLDSIKHQDYENKIEIIVVDNFSEDNTKIIANKFGVKFIEEKSERSKARNTAAKSAQGKYILYLDSDMYLSKSVISECINIFEHDKNKVALYIPEKIVGNGFWIKVRNFERGFYDATCIDAVRFVRIEIFRQIKGFDEKLVGGEDWDFDRRIREKGKTDIIKSYLYHNEAKIDIISYLKKKKFYSDTLNKYTQKWGKDDPIIKKQIGATYRFLGVFLESGKWKKIIEQPFLACPMLFLRFSVGLYFIMSKLNWNRRQGY